MSSDFRSLRRYVPSTMQEPRGPKPKRQDILKELLAKKKREEQEKRPRVCLRREKHAESGLKKSTERESAMQSKKTASGKAVVDEESADTADIRARTGRENIGISQCLYEPSDASDSIFSVPRCFLIVLNLRFNFVSVEEVTPNVLVMSWCLLIAPASARSSNRFISRVGNLGNLCNTTFIAATLHLLYNS